MHRNKKLIRLQNYNYSQQGYYFITICTENKKYFFGDIVYGKMMLNNCGKIADKCWQEIPQHYPNVDLDVFQVMPNHAHGIIIINNVGVQNSEPLQQANRFQHIIPRSVGSIIRGFKIGVTKQCRNEKIDFQWQRSFYDHIIRQDESLDKIREYIVNNPIKWDLDRHNPKNFG